MNEAIQNIKMALAPYYSSREIESLIKIIFEHLLHYSPVDIIMHKDSELSDYMIRKINDVVKQLISGTPIQYIFNEAYFDGHYFKVTTDTLIPRPETEELVEMIIKENTASDLKILDIGTGSGCIAISLALAMKFADVTAIDISTKAIEIGCENAQNLKAKVRFINNDIFHYCPPHDSFDIIVSNPPYICEKEKNTMESNVLDHEPDTALFVPDSEPLLFYDRIAKIAIDSLSNNGKLYFEINNLYADDIARMLDQLGYRNIEIRKDMYNLPRFVIAQKIKDNDW